MADPGRMRALQEELLSRRIGEWYDKVFSWQWGFLLIMLIIPWIIWWKIVDRRRLAEIFSFGLLGDCPKTSKELLEFKAVKSYQTPEKPNNTV